MISHDVSQAAPPTRTNPLAIAALVCGIVQFGFLFFKGLAVAGIAAVILGHLAIRQIRQSGDRGYGLAKAGLILGYVVLALGVLGVVVALVIGFDGPVLYSH